MNNPKSMVLGWVSLITVAGVSFYFAKQSINERRRQQQDISGERPSARLDWKERAARDRDEVQDPQAPGKAHPISPNNPNLDDGSRVSSSGLSSRDGAT